MAIKASIPRTLIAVGIWTFVALAGYGVIEAWSYMGGASISKSMTTVWNNEPWVILLLSFLTGVVIGFFGGHWFGQKRPEQYARRPG